MGGSRWINATRLSEAALRLEEAKRGNLGGPVSPQPNESLFVAASEGSYCVELVVLQNASSAHLPAFDKLAARHRHRPPSGIHVPSGVA